MPNQDQSTYSHRVISASQEAETAADRPLLSVVITGRDDDYESDFRYRLSTTVNYLARNAARLGRLEDLEIVVTDWGSPTPLVESMSLSTQARAITRFLYVPSELTDGRFHSSRAPNVGLRRARGEYIMLSNAGALVTEAGLDCMLKVLGGRLTLPLEPSATYFLLHRHIIPWPMVARQPTLNDWDRYLVLNPTVVRADTWSLLSIGEGAGALMMHRELWHWFRGFDERISGWGGNDCEFAMRVAQYHPWVDLTSFGVMVFKMDHSPSGRRLRDKTIIEPHNGRVVSPVVYVNDDNWGLGESQLQEQRPKAESPMDKSSGGSAVLPDVITCVAGVNSSLIRAHVRRVVRVGLAERRSVDRHTIEAMRLLAWYCLTCGARQYLEFGIRRAYCAMVIGAACPEAEIYGIDVWDGVPLRSGAQELGRDLYRSGLGYQGHCRLVNGAAAAGYDRLVNSSIGALTPDLVLLRPEMFSAASGRFAGLGRYLADRAAIVVSSGSRDTFEEAWRELQGQLPQAWRVRTASGHTGILMVNRLNANRDAEEAEVDVNTRWVGLARAEAQLARFWRLIRAPRLYGKRLSGLYARLRSPPKTSG